MSLFGRLGKALKPASNALFQQTGLVSKHHSFLYINCAGPLAIRTTKTVVRTRKGEETLLAEVSAMSLDIPPDRAVQITRLVDAFLRDADLSTVSVKKVRTHLANQVTYDILPYKQSLSALIAKRFDKILAEAEQNGQPTPATDNSSSPNGTASPATAPVPKKRKKNSDLIDEDARFAAKLHAELNSTRTRTTRNATSTTAGSKKKKAPAKKVKKSRARVEDSDDSQVEESAKKKRKINRNNPFNALQLLSEPLAALVGEEKLSRPSTVKEIWKYVKANNLQDDTDRRYIICDDRLRAVFNSDRIHMFKMNKILSSHFSPLPPEMQPTPEEMKSTSEEVVTNITTAILHTDIDDAAGEPDSETTSPVS